MKKCLLTLFLVALMTLQAVADSSGVCGNDGNVKWKFFSSNGELVIYGNGNMTNYASVDAAPWYSLKNEVKFVVIKEGVTSVGKCAFGHLANARFIYIGNTVKEIKPGAFVACTGISRIDIPDSVTTIGSTAFTGCSGVKYVWIGSSVSMIGSQAFAGCKSISTIYANPSSAPTCESKVFATVDVANCVLFIHEELGFSTYKNNEGWSDFTTIKTTPYTNGGANEDGSVWWHLAYGKNMYVEGTGAMSDYYGTDLAYEMPWYHNRNIMESVKIREGVTNVGDGSFLDCVKLNSVSLPSTLKKIGAMSFCGCKSLSYITIPENVLTIWVQAFEDCEKLSSITTPKSLTTIGAYAFNGCSSLRSVLLEESVKRIDSKAFNGCSALKTITTLNTTPPTLTSTTFSSENYTNCRVVVKTSAMANTYRAANVWSKFSNFVVSDAGYSGKAGDLMDWDYNPETNVLTLTGEGEMYDWGRPSTVPWESYAPYIKSIVVGSKIKSIGDFAFYDCTKLTTVTLSYDVKNIGMYAFAGCTALKDFTTFSNYNDATIGKYAFTQCSSLETVTILKKIGSIGEYAFNGCSKLKSIACASTTPPSCQSTTFAGVDKTSCKVSVPTSSLSKYKIATGWKDFSSFTTSDASFWGGNIGDNVYWSFDPATNTLSFTGSGPMCENSHVMNTGFYQLRDNIYNVTMSDEITTITDHAFQKYSNLKTVTLSKGLTSIGQDAFYGTGITTVTLPATLKWLEQESFGNCKNLESVYSLNPVPPVMSSGVDQFWNVDKENCIIYAPIESLEAYKKNFPWSSFSHIYPIYTNKAMEYTDVNRDAQVNGADVVAIYNYISNGTGSQEFANVNGDEAVNGADIVGIYNYISTGANPRKKYGSRD